MHWAESARARFPCKTIGMIYFLTSLSFKTNRLTDFHFQIATELAVTILQQTYRALLYHHKKLCRFVETVQDCCLQLVLFQLRSLSHVYCPILTSSTIFILPFSSTLLLRCVLKNRNRWSLTSILPIFFRIVFKILFSFTTLRSPSLLALPTHFILSVFQKHQSYPYFYFP